MSKLNSKIVGSKSTISALSAASTIIKELGTKRGELSDYSGRVLGTESFSAENADAGATTVENALKKSPILKGASPAAIESARIVMAAVGDTNSYARKLGTESYSNAMAWANDDGYSSESVLGTEYFSDKDLGKHLEKSLLLNVRVAEQTPFAEAFFKTIAVDPSDSGVTFRMKKLRVHRGARHSLFTDRAREFKPRNAIDALTDPTILRGDDLALVPYKPETQEHDEHFVSEDLFPARYADVAGQKIRTSYLNFDVTERNLLALAASPLLIGNNLLNETDEIAEGAELARVLVSVRKKGQALADGSFIELTTRGMGYAGLDKTVQGDGRELQLAFRANMFRLTGDTKDYKGDTIEAVSALKSGGYQLQYEIQMNNFVRADRGLETVNKPTTHKRKVVDNSGEQKEISGPIKSMVDNIVIEVVGYDYAMTLTNENKRSHGLLADAYWFDENYKIRLTDPITTKTPPTGVEVDDSSKLEDLISLVNIGNENKAVDRMIEYTNTLREVCKTIVDDFDEKPAPISGIARHFIRPWLEEDVFDISKVVGSLSTKDDVENARMGLINMIRAQVSVALQRSRLLTNLRASSGNFELTPTVTIGTDTVVADLLQIMGDANLLGRDINTKVVTTNDIRFYPKNKATGKVERRLQWAFTIDADGESYQFFNYGHHLWVPPLVSNTQLTREGSTAQELTVQPRNLHVVNVPVGGVITVIGTEEWYKVRKHFAIEFTNPVTVEKEEDEGSVVPTP